LNGMTGRSLHDDCRPLGLGWALVTVLAAAGCNDGDELARRPETRLEPAIVPAAGQASSSSQILQGVVRPPVQTSSTDGFRLTGGFVPLRR
jgi:hypothetical protein